MARSTLNPAHVPTPDAIRARIEHHRQLTRQLRALLAFSLRVHGDAKQPDRQAAPSGR